VARGFLGGLGGIAVLAALIWLLCLLADVSHPSEALFRDLRDVGIGVFLAFVVATAGARLRDGELLSRHLNWLGYSCGFATAGFLSIAASVGLAAYREAGHAGALDLIGLSWIGAALLMLGLCVAALPYAVFNWDRPVDT
jgi:hypothetical protein